MKRLQTMLTAALVACSAANPAQAYYAAWNGVPDFDQVRSSAPGITGLCGDGKNFCGPTSVTNWLGFINNHGYPIIKPGAPNWQTQYYNTITNLIEHEKDHMTSWPATVCGSGTPQGKIDDGLRDHLNEFSSTKEKFFFVEASSSGSSYVAPVHAYLWMFTGGMITMGIGWYNYDPSSDKWTRDGGHWVSLVGVEDANPEELQHTKVSIHNPGGSDGDQLNEGEGTFQSPFKTSVYDAVREWVTIRGKYQIGYDNRYQYRMKGLKNGAFFDSYTAMVSPWLVGLPSFTESSAARQARPIPGARGGVATPESLARLVVADAPDNNPFLSPSLNGTGRPGTGHRDIRLPFSIDTVSQLRLHPALPAAFARTQAKEGGQIWYFDPARGAFPVGETEGSGPMAVGVDSEVFAASDRVLEVYRFDTAELRSELDTVIDLDMPVDALGVNDLNGDLVGLNAAERLLQVFPQGLEGMPETYVLDSAVEMPRSPVLEFDPSTASLWLTGAETTALTRLKLDPRAGLAYAGEVARLEAPVAPTSITFVDSGRIVAWANGDVVEYVREGERGYRRSTEPSRFAGQGIGPHMRAGRSHAPIAPLDAEDIQEETVVPDEGAHQLCAIDLTGEKDPEMPDGIVDDLDEIRYLELWDAGEPRADLDNGAGQGVQDRRVDEADLRYFEGLSDTRCL